MAIANDQRENGSENASQLNKQPGWWHSLTIALAPIALLFISLGEATDAGFLLRDLSRELYGFVSNAPEYETLANLHIGNTEEYAAKLVGMPQVSRSLGDKLTAKYFYRGDYLLTLFTTDDRILAYTVIVLDEDFTPAFDVYTEESRELGSFNYIDVAVEPVDFVTDNSQIIRFYMELFDAGRTGSFLKTYLGNIEYGVGAIPDALAPLYQAQVVGTDERIGTMRAEIRRNTRPNFYGRGEIGLELVARSLLTTPEFQGYFIN